MPKQDNLTSAETTLTYDHHLIHDQCGFSIAYNTGSLSADALHKAVLTTPASSVRKAVHLRPANFSATSNVMRLAIYEDSTNSSGTSSVIYNHFRKSDTRPASSTFKTGVTAALTGKNMTSATAGGNFANQPAGDGLEVVSDNAADVGMILTVYGTKTGSTVTVTTETVTLNGTTQASTTTTTWQNILGLELSAACAGTVTVREASGNATIITFSAGELSKGVVTISDSRGRDQILRAISSGASTAPVGAIGISPSGSVVSSVVALNGTNSVNLNSDIFRTVTKFLNGAAASTVNITFSRPEVLLNEISVGSGGVASTRTGGGAGADDEWVLEAGTDYVIVVTNGATTASTGYVNFFFYEEEY